MTPLRKNTLDFVRISIVCEDILKKVVNNFALLKPLIDG